jgi:hypothetical protein
VAGPSISPPGTQLVSGITPHVNVGGVRLALVIVLIVGAAGAIGGSVLRFGTAAELNRLRRLSRFGLRLLILRRW